MIHIFHKWENHKTISKHEYMGESYEKENNSFRFCRKCGRVERWIEADIDTLIGTGGRCGHAYWSTMPKEWAEIYMRLKVNKKEVGE